MKQIMVLLMATLLWAQTVQAKGRAGEFDYYAMALSWSPHTAYCWTAVSRAMAAVRKRSLRSAKE